MINIRQLIEDVKKLQSSNKFDEAVSYVLTVIETYPTISIGYRLLAQLLNSKGDFLQAEKILLDGIEKTQNKDDVVWLFFDYCRLAEQRQDWQESYKRARQAMKNYPKRFEGYRISATALKEMGRYSEADECVLKGMKNVDDYATREYLFLEYVKISEKAGNWAEMVNRAELLCRDYPTNYQGYNWKANALLHLGLIEESKKIIEKGLSLFPQNKILQNTHNKVQPMVFSLSNTENLIRNNLLSVEILQSQFQRADLIENTIYKDTIGQPRNSHRKVVEMIDKFLTDSKYKFKRSGNIHFNVNVAYFAPTVFLKSTSLELFDIFSQFSLKYIKFVLSKKEIVDYILFVVENDCNSDKLLSQLSPIFLINFLFALSAHNCISVERELCLCKKILKMHGVQKNEMMIKSLIERRVNSLNILGRYGVKNNINSHSRVALVISGQLRGFEEAMPKLMSKFAHLPHVDAYVSTWDAIGHAPFAPTRLERILEKPACDYVKINFRSLNFSKINLKLDEMLAKSYPIDRITTSIHNLLSWCKSVSINVQKEKVSPYNTMSNDEKMYYHNSYWVEKMGVEFFNQYDVIIKIRPDYGFLDLTPFDIGKVKQNLVFTDFENNYVFRDWGFGIGDQLWIGTAQNITTLLNCYKNSLISAYMKRVEKKSFLGHRNCGIQAWLEGFEITGDSNIGRHTLVDTRKITLEQLQSVIND